MPGRKLNTQNYSFGFNGQIQDSEWMGGQSVAFEFRTQDARLGRFLSTDPLTAMTPWETPYAFANNSPVAKIDYLGLSGERKAGKHRRHRQFKHKRQRGASKKKSEGKVRRAKKTDPPAKGKKQAKGNHKSGEGIRQNARNSTLANRATPYVNKLLRKGGYLAAFAIGWNLGKVLKDNFGDNSDGYNGKEIVYPDDKPDTSGDTDTKKNKSEKYSVYITIRGTKSSAVEDANGVLKYSNKLVPAVNQPLYYVGISINEEDRYGNQQMQMFFMETIFDKELSKDEARGVEQLIIELNTVGYPKVAASPNLDNLINSTSTARDVYLTRKALGQKVLNGRYPDWKTRFDFSKSLRFNNKDIPNKIKNSGYDPNRQMSSFDLPSLD